MGTKLWFPGGWSGSLTLVERYVDLRLSNIGDGHREGQGVGR
jgi:hypothetical protein